MEFNGEIVKFNIYDAMKYPGDDNPVYSIDVIDSLAQEVLELDGKDEMEVAISKHVKKECSDPKRGVLHFMKSHIA